MEILLLAAVLSTSFILFAAGAEHVAGQATFRSRIQTHRLFGARAVRLAGAVLPVLELLVSIGAFWSVATASRSLLLVSLLLQTALFFSFAGYLVMVVRAGNGGVPCGCGPAEVPVGRSAIARAIGLGVLSCVSAVSLVAFGVQALTIRADGRGLLAGAAGFVFAVLLVILAPARRLEPNSGPDDADRTSAQVADASHSSHSHHPPDAMMIGTA